MSRHLASVVCASLAATALVAGSSTSVIAAGPMTGPSTTVTPYVIPASPFVTTQSLWTVDDLTASNGVGMTGVPDGLGMKRGGPGFATVYMNHELQAAQGVVRAHGQTGAFVSKEQVDLRTGEIVSSVDLIKRTQFYDYTSGSYSGTAPAGFSPQFIRFCSGSLSDPGALYNAATGNGYKGQLYFANEEAGDGGRTFGVNSSGLAYQLPRLGLASFENTNVAPTTTDATVVVSNEDGSAGQLRIYVGSKQGVGNAFERAGLTNGTLNVLDLNVNAVTTDAAYRATYGKGAAVKAHIEPIDDTASGASQNSEAASVGLSLNRIEDGAFDPSHPNDFYFVTTEGGDTTSRESDSQGNPIARDGGGLWKLHFNNFENPSTGLTLTLLLDGSEAPFLSKPDNVVVDRAGHLMIQEDPGNNLHIARVLAYNIADGRIEVVAQFDPARFGENPTSTPATQDEESSGIIDAGRFLGAGSFVFDAQVHTSAGLSDPVGQVEHGQLLRMFVDFSSLFPPSS